MINPGDMILVPASLLSRAIQLVGKIPAESSADVYIALTRCQPAPNTETKTDDEHSEN